MTGAISEGGWGVVTAQAFLPAAGTWQIDF